MKPKQCFNIGSKSLTQLGITSKMTEGKSMKIEDFRKMSKNQKRKFLNKKGGSL